MQFIVHLMGRHISVFNTMYNVFVGMHMERAADYVRLLLIYAILKTVVLQCALELLIFLVEAFIKIQFTK